MWIVAVLNVWQICQWTTNSQNRYFAISQIQSGENTGWKANGSCWTEKSNLTVEASKIFYQLPNRPIEWTALFHKVKRETCFWHEHTGHLRCVRRSSLSELEKLENFSRTRISSSDCKMCFSTHLGLNYWWIQHKVISIICAVLEKDYAKVSSHVQLQKIAWNAFIERPNLSRTVGYKNISHVCNSCKHLYATTVTCMQCFIRKSFFPPIRSSGISEPPRLPPFHAPFLFRHLPIYKWSTWGHPTALIIYVCNLIMVVLLTISSG